MWERPPIFLVRDLVPRGSIQTWLLSREPTLQMQFGSAVIVTSELMPTLRNFRRAYFSSGGGSMRQVWLRFSVGQGLWRANALERGCWSRS